MTQQLRLYVTFFSLSAAACGDSNTNPSPDVQADAALSPDGALDPDAKMLASVPTAYTFASKSDSNVSSVSYSGQVFRHLLISELDAYIGRLTEQVETTPPVAGSIRTNLNFYFEFDSTVGGTQPLTISTTPPLLQQTFDDVSSGKNLLSKLAGNDTVTDYVMWNTPGTMRGWGLGDNNADTPTKLVRYWFSLLDDLAVQRGLGNIPSDPTDTPIEDVFITAKGQNLRQLTRTFLLGALALSQASDDYLDDDVDGKGLLATNESTEENTYTALEHAIDEGYGYFGAARDYGNYTDEEIASTGGRPDYQSYHDSDGDGAIDLLTEFNTGASIDCAKRDRDSLTEAPTDFTQTAFDALLAARHIVATTSGELSDPTAADLRTQRDIIVNTWEQCIAATAVHAINNILDDMAAFETDNYNFANHATHWSELKGAALSLQFSPHSPLRNGTAFADLHTLIGDAPVLSNAIAANIAQYITDLQTAREQLGDAYGFAAANLENW